MIDRKSQCRTNNTYIQFKIYSNEQRIEKRFVYLLIIIMIDQLAFTSWGSASPFTRTIIRYNTCPIYISTRQSEPIIAHICSSCFKVKRIRRALTKPNKSIVWIRYALTENSCVQMNVIILVGIVSCYAFK